VGHIEDFGKYDCPANPRLVAVFLMSRGYAFSGKLSTNLRSNHKSMPWDFILGYLERLASCKSATQLINAQHLCSVLSTFDLLPFPLFLLRHESLVAAKFPVVI
jgi:hypothetical protein